MILNFLLRFHALLAAAYAFALLVLPRATIALLSGEALGEVGAAIARLFGAALLLIALIAWGTSRLRDQDARRLLTAGFFVYAVLGTGIALVGQLDGTWNALGWTTVITYLILVLGYGYVLVARLE
ncbi:MAG TPA: hypothetical protein VEZ12_22375 [Herpetosiphonaceae bacterium]|nr:hypothetical protein [Herpetosiphonaceae bacterium]